jgi:hypothetical protein
MFRKCWMTLATRQACGAVTHGDVDAGGRTQHACGLTAWRHAHLGHGEQVDERPHVHSLVLGVDVAAAEEFFHLCLAQALSSAKHRQLRYNVPRVHL